MLGQVDFTGMEGGYLHLGEREGGMHRRRMEREEA